jgi:zinc-binding in reverse transcriptase
VVAWKQTPNGNYTIKLFYLFLKQGPLILSDLYVIWDLIPPRMQVFIWTMVQNKILTIEALKRRGWSIVGICYMCKSNDESTNYLFNECQFFSIMLMLLFRRLNISMMVLYHDSTQQIILNRAVRKKIREVMAIACFVVWRERCNRIFREENKIVVILIEGVREKWNLLNKRGIS